MNPVDEFGRILVVVAHPDDEALGCGGTIARASRAGLSVAVGVMCGGADARGARPSSNELASDFEESIARLGAHALAPGDFPNIRMNTVPHLALVQHVEALIRTHNPDTVITHYSADLNDDHRQTASAVMTAVRLPQRVSDVSPIRRVLMMETLSATDWSFDQISPGRFSPNTFVSLDESDIVAKLDALSAYRGVMRLHPHPRSVEAIRALATVRGAESGVMTAEAFRSIFEVVA